MFALPWKYEAMLFDINVGCVPVPSKVAMPPDTDTPVPNVEFE